MKNIIKYAFIAMLAVSLANCGKDSDSLTDKENVENSGDNGGSNSNSNGNNNGSGSNNGGGNNSGNTASSILGTWFFEKKIFGKDEEADNCVKKSYLVFTNEVKSNKTQEKLYTETEYHTSVEKCVSNQYKFGYKILSGTKIMMERDYEKNDGGTWKVINIELEFDYSISGDTLTLKGKDPDGESITFILKKK